MGLQRPSTQSSPTPHVLPQKPQCRRSRDASTQPSPQSVVPGRHAQVEATHTWPPLHALPHAPQCSTSVPVVTHAPPQST
jgi:hypothetical protein